MSSAFAQEIDPKHFKDWLTLSALLQSKGINPSAPSWSVIMPMCLPLRKSDDETEYNKCLYDKTMDEYNWHNDNKTCSDRADSDYDKYVQSQRTITTAVITDSNGKKKIVQQDTTALNPPRNLRSRDSFYRDCMTRDMYWNDSNLWTVGHKEVPASGSIINNNTVINNNR